MDGGGVRQSCFLSLFLFPSLPDVRTTTRQETSLTQEEAKDKSHRWNLTTVPYTVLPCTSNDMDLSGGGDVIECVGNNPVS